MTIVQMIELFDLLVDKVGAPYFDESEKLTYLNTSNLEVLERYMFPWKYKDPNQTPANEADPMVGFENNEFITNYVSRLTSPIQVSSDVDGKVLKADMDAAVSTKVYHINSMSINGCKVRYVRHNDHLELGNLPQKKPTAAFPWRRTYDTYHQVDPSSNDTVDIEVTRYPVEMTVAPQVDSELPDELHNDIVYRALSLAGISIREPEFYQMIKNEYNTEQ